MYKLAIFVEGQTEQIFIERLVKEIAGKNKVDVVLQHASGGNKYARKFTTIKGTNNEEVKDYMILIVDSATDSKVVSDMKDQYPSLLREGYSKILGLRDLYPESFDKLGKLEMLNDIVLKNSITNGMYKLIIAVMEVETWFIAEYKHFNKFHKNLNKDLINTSFGIDIVNDNLESSPLYAHPAELLHKVYQIVGGRYDKKKNTVNNIIQLLDYEELYINCPSRLNKFNELIVELDNFF